MMVTSSTHLLFRGYLASSLNGFGTLSSPSLSSGIGGGGSFHINYVLKVMVPVFFLLLSLVVNTISL